MISAILFSYASAHALILFLTFRNPGAHSTFRADPRLWYVRFLIAAIIIDNLTQALGPMLIDSAFYEIPNRLRFGLHSILVPPLLIFAVSIFIIPMENRRVAYVFMLMACLLTACGIAYGAYHEILLLELQVADPAPLGHLKLVNAHSSPPWATIIANLLVLPLAAWIWAKQQWRWLLFGAGFIFIVNGAAAAAEWGFLAGNFAEVVFVASLWRTALHFRSDKAEQAGY